MNNQRTTCDPERIELFLQQKLNDAEQTAFESHLDDCDDCRQRLESTAASQAIWSGVCDSLRDQPLTPDDLCSGDSAIDSATGEDHSSSQATVLKLLAPTDDDRMIGRWGTYEVVGVVGTGGMGVVLKALDAALNRYVAIKVLAPHLGNSGGARKRFSREAQAAAAVVHDNVMEIYGVAETAGLPYLVMPYVRGPSLQRRLDDEGPLALAEILRVGMQAAATRKAEYDIAADIAQKPPDAVAKKRLDVLSLKRKEAERAIERAEGNQRAALEAASVAKAELHAAQLKAAAVESMPGAGWNPGAGNEAASAAKQPEQGNTFDAGSKAAENSAADLTAGPRTTPAKPSQPQSEGPLRVSPLPAGWKFEYDNTKGIDFYSAMPQPEGSGVLMFSRWPPPSKPEDIPALVRQIADGFLENAKKSPGVALTSEKYDLKQFVGDHCQGNYAVFQLRNAGVQAMFMMSVNGQTWSGQFTGTPDDWQKALELLKTIKEH